jgi:hypothetical protein
MSNPQQTVTAPETEISIPAFPLRKLRVRFSLIVTLTGLLIFLIGARPGLFGLDRSPVVGFIQISVMLIGLAFICLGGYGSIHELWRREIPGIGADIGLRLVSTGYVVTLFSGMADIFGIGSHPLPGVPLFGIWQARGMEIGCALIAIGFIMMYPYRHKDPD